jgi:hypothetical protein
LRDHEIAIKGKRPTLPWREKTYLYPAILQRKWIDYKIKDKFIPHVNFDNVLPCILQYNLINPIAEPVEISIRSIDKQYRNLLFQIIESSGHLIFERKIENLFLNKDSKVKVAVKKPGTFQICITTEDKRYYKSSIIFYKNQKKLSVEDFNILISDQKRKMDFFCRNCRCKVYPIDKSVIHRHIYKNYIPFKEYIDLENLGMEFISLYLMKLDHPSIYKKGLIHLLNIIRLSTVQDEITIVTNLYKDDPSFAYFVTSKLFLFNMIPLMQNHDLQKILNTIDDSLISMSLMNENREMLRKVLMNISRRRAKIIQNEKYKYGKKKESVKAKYEIHKVIKSYFEEHYGRLLRIPYRSKLVYSVKSTSSIQQNDELVTYMTNHNGAFISTDENQSVFTLDTINRDTCMQFDYESHMSLIFSIAGISEGTIFLKCEMGLRYTLIHTYYWITNLEDSEFYENISRNMIIPLNYLSSGLILTVGAISGNGTPYEQILRLKIY